MHQFAAICSQLIGKQYDVDEQNSVAQNGENVLIENKQAPLKLATAKKCLLLKREIRKARWERGQVIQYLLDNLWFWHLKIVFFISAKKVSRNQKEFLRQSLNPSLVFPSYKLFTFFIDQRGRSGRKKKKEKKKSKYQINHILTESQQLFFKHLEVYHHFVIVS